MLVYGAFTLTAFLRIGGVMNTTRKVKADGIPTSKVCFPGTYTLYSDVMNANIRMLALNYDITRGKNDKK
jgi:hypothetical protein